MLQINNGFKPCYYLTKDGKVYNIETKNFLSIDRHKYKLTNLKGIRKSISLKELYRLVYNEIYCVDNIQSEPKEVWAEIPGTDGNYFCSNLGRVKSYKKYEAILVKEATNCNGYKRLQIIQYGKIVNKFVHRLVAQCFLPPPPGIDYQLHHIDGNPRNNKADNLTWVSQEQHSKIHNTKDQEKEKINNE